MAPKFNPFVPLTQAKAELETSRELVEDTRRKLQELYEQRHALESRLPDATSPDELLKLEDYLRDANAGISVLEISLPKRLARLSSAENVITTTENALTNYRLQVAWYQQQFENQQKRVADLSHELEFAKASNTTHEQNMALFQAEINRLEGKL